jgi:hypothetical protein
MKKIKWLFPLFILGSLTLADDIVEFHIAPGTGSKPWNTPETVVNVKVGQILRVINDDSVVHTLHTFGRPCPHQPDDSQPGEFYDCEIKTAADPRVDLMYDHAFGDKARFYVNATN